jgi:hypothetical protein
MFAVRPRFWVVNVRANAIDIIIGVSTLAFMTATTNELVQLCWAILWAGWLIVIKPRADTLWVSLQALIGFAAGLSALFLTWDHAPLFVLVGVAGLLCFFAAHHFFYSFDEPYTRMLAYFWAYFGAALVWVLGHWLLLTLVQPWCGCSVIGYSFMDQLPSRLYY